MPARMNVNQPMKLFFRFLCVLVLFFAFFSEVSAQYAVGHFQTTFQDPARNNRSIPTEIYYPATSAGSNTPVAQGQFPVIVFGHGFAMVWTAYENLWEEFVPRGYIMVFPTTEGGLISVDHQDFGWDLQFLVTAMQFEGANSFSPIFGAVANNTALMGHSMGGGAAFLAADSLSTNGNPYIKTLVGLAPAESSTNGVSSIASATQVTLPAVIFSGRQDGVTPPTQHHIPMYDSLASACKTFIDIIGGAHCYFADPNFNCDFGESVASQGISITREEQHATTYAFLNAWLDYTLYDSLPAFQQFQDSLQALSQVTYMQDCNVMTNLEAGVGDAFEVYPNPAQDIVTFSFPPDFNGSLHIHDLRGVRVLEREWTPSGAEQILRLSARRLPSGLYWVQWRDAEGQLRKIRKLLLR